ncbi:hypothetical protein F1559_001143 [Cyanidiococcus yangmingshanensis]|uniref:Protein root UVB sensitive/RUS domain-containing protein n=1 Tax=Cyanidiococcus yangmingshanensis TaxID=2690220 RepID=A0A7J7IGA6_9RHOD|nr:hypothetical protein F1559_001143 [Cyanidiococcus yangmingshanensis]
MSTRTEGVRLSRFGSTDAPTSQADNMATIKLALTCHDPRLVHVFLIRSLDDDLDTCERPFLGEALRYGPGIGPSWVSFQPYLQLHTIGFGTPKTRDMNGLAMYTELLTKLRTLSPQYLYVSDGCRLLVTKAVRDRSCTNWSWQMHVRHSVTQCCHVPWVIFPPGQKKVVPTFQVDAAALTFPLTAGLVLLETGGMGQVRTFRVPDVTDDERQHPFVINVPRDERPILERLRNWLVHVYLPHGYPHTVTQDYLAFTWWRLLQNTAASIMGVFSTEALLLGLGLGKNVSGTAQAVQWILKDGFGHAGKIAYAALAGKQFDIDPQSWRIMSDLLEDVAGVLEIITPIFSGQFLILASVATTMKAVAAMTGTATRHAIYKSMALAENQGDLATKGESQGVTTKLVGLGLGIAISKRIGQDYTALLMAYGLAAVVHLAANFKAMQCVEFSTLNRQRMALLVECLRRCSKAVSSKRQTSFETAHTT